MKISHIIIALCSILALIIFLGAVLFLRPDAPAGSPIGETAEATASTIANAAELYSELLEQIANSDLELSVLEIRDITTPQIQYQAQRENSISLDRNGAENQYHMAETMTMGALCVDWEQYYVDSRNYYTVSGLHYQEAAPTKTSIDPYLLSRPAYLATALDPNCYQQVIATQTPEGYSFQFLEATQPEKWLYAENYQWDSVEASVTYTEATGALTYFYSANLYLEQTKIHASYQVTLTPTEAEIALPAPEGGWLPLADSQAPLLLELSAGILLQADSIASAYHEEIYFEALGDRRIREISLQMADPDNLNAQVVTKTTTTKDSRLDQPEIISKDETFQDGQYILQQDEQPPAIDPTITQEAMVEYLHNQLISTIMLPEYIADCTVETDGSRTIYHFTGNAAFAEFLCRNGGQQLYGDPELLVSDTVSVTTDTLTCHLEIDNALGLPVASGIILKGSYKNQGLPYHFTYEVSQTYSYPAN